MSIKVASAEYWLEKIYNALAGSVGTGAATPLSVSLDALGDAAGDAFGRLQVAEPYTIFDSKQITDNQPLFWDDAQTSGAGTASAYNANQASTTIRVSNLTAGVRARQTFQRPAYQPGKAQIVTLTGVCSAAAAGITHRWGAFDAKNGLFFEQTSAGVRCGVREYTSGAAHTSYSAYLNLTMADGAVISPQRNNIWFIAFEWYSAGDVIFGVFYNRRPVTLQVIRNTNNMTGAYMSTPNLPLRYEISNDGTGPAAMLTHICAGIVSSGGRQDSGIARRVDRGATPIVTLNDGDVYPLLAIRLRTGYEGAQVKPTNAEVMCTSTAVYRWSLLLNPTVAGTALAFTAVTNSAVEADTATTSGTKVSGGILLASGYGQQSNTSETSIAFTLPDRLRLGVSIAGVSDVLVLAVQRISGTTESFYGVMGWGESI